jgi:BirA family transcriptional regulator, biotin operon repressor / biotin---[acetyl-CoA-carboxylase] ligase
MWARDRLRADKLRGCGFVIGREVIVLEETGSTNDVVREMASGDWPEGLCVFAEHQTAARGQRGNKWEAAPQKGLWFSILLRPKIDIGDSPRLSEWAARVIAETIGDATVKLPNDVYIGEHKVAGVLVEMRAQSGAPHIAVVGIGVNVNHAAEDFPEELRARATSLAMIRRVRQDRHLLARKLLQNLDRSYAEMFR